jgi:hypothetical protein
MGTGGGAKRTKHTDKEPNTEESDDDNGNPISPPDPLTSNDSPCFSLFFDSDLMPYFLKLLPFVDHLGAVRLFSTCKLLYLRVRRREERGG